MSHIGIFIAFMLLAGCYSAPHEVGAGFHFGGQSRSDVSAGASGTLRRHGAVFSGDGSGLVGAKWKGGAYGGAYGHFDDEYAAARGAVNGEFAGGLDGNLKGKLGVDEDGNIPIGLQGKVGAFKKADFGGNGVFATAEQGDQLADLYRDSGFDNPHLNF